MGIAISSWTLAKAVAEQGHLGVVSSAGLGNILISRLMDGDTGGHTRRALSCFPFQESVKRILDKYYVAGGKASNQSYKRHSMWTIKPSKTLDELTIIANFVEVFLAKEEHGNPVGINLLEKVQLPTMSSLYGAMLAGVDFVIVGAGIPTQIPGILDKLAEHQEVSYRLDVMGVGTNGDYIVHFNPENVFPDMLEKTGKLKRPNFLPIISSVVLALALIKRATGKVDGFVIETPIAGGHNAPPRGRLNLDENGEPIYGKKDVIDLEKIKKLGLPFWLAGGYGTPEGLQKALEAGATGIQVGTMFAYCNESGMDKQAKKSLVQKSLNGSTSVRTDPVVSPTGFPFKVVELEGSLSEEEVYQARPRLCDIGYLRHIYELENGKVGYRCPAEPVDHYVKKGGTSEDAEQRGCLCNNLMAAAGFSQHRKDGYVEPALITSGDRFSDLPLIVKPNQSGYSAKDVIEYLTNGATDF